MGNWLIRNMGKIIKAKKKGGGDRIKSHRRIYTPKNTVNILFHNVKKSYIKLWFTSKLQCFYNLVLALLTIPLRV